MEEKVNLIFNLLEANKNDWEATLFQLLAKNFGLNVNGNAFLKWAQQISFSIIRKNAHDPIALEALFFGLSGLLKKEIEETLIQLRRDYCTGQRLNATISQYTTQA